MLSNKKLGGLLLPDKLLYLHFILLLVTRILAGCLTVTFCHEIKLLSNETSLFLSRVSAAIYVMIFF